MLLTESKLRKIIAEEYAKLREEEDNRAPPEHRIATSKSDTRENTPYNNILALLATGFTSERKSAIAQLQSLLDYKADGDKETLKSMFDQPNVRLASNPIETAKYIRMVKTVIDDEL